jgi:hypothetical protein
VAFSICGPLVEDKVLLGLRRGKSVPAKRDTNGCDEEVNT